MMRLRTRRDDCILAARRLVTSCRRARHFAFGGPLDDQNEFIAPSDFVTASHARQPRSVGVVRVPAGVDGVLLPSSYPPCEAYVSGLIC